VSATADGSSSTFVGLRFSISVLAAEKDERVHTGGVSDRTASGVDDAATNVEEAEREMLEALARRTRGDTE
jgi:hypothetical protein